VIMVKAATVEITLRSGVVGIGDAGQSGTVERTPLIDHLIEHGLAYEGDAPAVEVPEEPVPLLGAEDAPPPDTTPDSATSGS